MEQPKQPDDRYQVRFRVYRAAVDATLIGVTLPMIALSVFMFQPAFNVRAFAIAVACGAAIAVGLDLTLRVSVDRAGIRVPHPLPSRRFLSWTDISESKFRRVILSRWVVLSSGEAKTWLPLETVRDPMFREAIDRLAPSPHTLRNYASDH